MAAPISQLTSKKWGLDPASLKAAFDADKIAAKKGAFRLADSIRGRIQDGIERNRRDYRLFKAMDWAYDSPFYQISYTQLRGLINSNPSDQKVMETVNQWGLTHLLPDVLDGNGQPCMDANGKCKKALDLPTFFNVFVPVCMAYITIRWAKLFNDRNIHPHFKYDPAQFTVEDRMRCELITQIVQKQSSWFDYPADTKQVILQTLMYGVCISFPREAWFCERQMQADGTKKIVREGLRFHMPHPSRMSYDPYHRLSTLNSNSGCEYAGYWGLQRYRDIKENKLFWNTDKISMGSISWFDIGQSDFLEQVYPCVMKFPSADRGAGAGLGGAGALDRESDIRTFYGSGHEDTAALETNHFQRLVPKDWDLGDYDEPIWMRFVVGSDSPVLWAEPLPFDVLPTSAYDADFNRARFRSLCLEIVPFQDHVSNVLSQWILAVKQNLTNPVFVDADKIPEEYMKQLMNMGAKRYGGTVFVPFSTADNMKFRVDQKEAIFQPQMARHNTGELAALVSGILSMLDRIMQLSPQEIGQAASHEQTAEESRIVARNTSTRVEFTGTFIDSHQNAKKKMIYDATMAYADDGIVVGISSSFARNSDEMKEVAKKIGVEILEESGKEVTKVRVKKSAIIMEEFASTREAASRMDTPAVADAMAKMFIAIAGNEVLVRSVGAAQLVDLMNQIMITAGLPKEFRLRGEDIKMDGSPEEQSGQLQQMLTGFAEQVKQMVAQTQQETLQAAGAQTVEMIQKAMQEVMTQLQPLAQATQQAAEVDAQQQQQIDALAAAVTQVAKVAATPPQPTTLMSPEMPPMGLASEMQ